MNRIFYYSNPDSEVRKNSSAGGFFYELATIILNGGGIVYGAAFNENWNITHKRVDNIAGLQSLQRSKYAFSFFSHVFELVEKDLSAGKQVLFTGTPCQIGAIKKRFGENTNLFCLEVICHGAPDQNYWIQYLEALCKSKETNINNIEDINFRDKTKGWKNYSFSIKFKDGKSILEDHANNLYMRAFLKDYILREACFNCKFKYPENSKANLTVGDFWGISNIAPTADNNLGTSIIIINREINSKVFPAISKWIDKLSNDFNLSNKYEEIVKCNPAIESCPSKPLNIESFKREYSASHDILKLFQKYAGRSFSDKAKDKIISILRKLKK